MTDSNSFDVIIIGGSYSGLAAGMALGRALRKVLIIDSGLPCNAQTPHSHNFITQDGVPPAQIAAIAKSQVEQYATVSFFNGLATAGNSMEGGFEIQIASGQLFKTRKLIFATGISDILPDIQGIKECWGITAVHCPYCHGYEIRNKKTGILGNGDPGYDLTMLISNWTKDLVLFTNGKSSLLPEQTEKLQKHNIQIIEQEIEALEHTDGMLKAVKMKNGNSMTIEAIYNRPPFKQHCNIPQALGCDLTEEGFIATDNFQKTTVPGIFACGDNSTFLRTVANAVSTGTTAGMMANKQMVVEEF